MVPGLKETEVIGYAYKMMAQDISNNVVEVSVWDDMLKLDFGDKEKKLEFSETRGCYVADADFEIVINKNKKYPAAYLNRENVNRAPLAYVTKLVLYYVRLKLQKEKNAAQKIEIQNLDGVELLSRVTDRAANLILNGNIGKILDFLKEN